MIETKVIGRQTVKVVVVDGLEIQLEECGSEVADGWRVWSANKGVKASKLSSWWPSFMEDEARAYAAERQLKARKGQKFFVLPSF